MSAVPPACVVYTVQIAHRREAQRPVRHTDAAAALSWAILYYTTSALTYIHRGWVTLPCHLPFSSFSKRKKAPLDTTHAISGRTRAETIFDIFSVQSSSILLQLFFFASLVCPPANDGRVILRLSFWIFLFSIHFANKKKPHESRALFFPISLHSLFVFFFLFSPKIVNCPFFTWSRWSVFVTRVTPESKYTV